jgi:hypothetical protein
MPSTYASSRVERLLIGKTLCTAGMILLSVGLALCTMAFTDLSAPVRTAGGLAVSLLIGIIGQVLYRHNNEDSYVANSWFTRATLCSAYGLAYFFIYAMYYVPYLHSMDTPYLCWALMLGLAFVGTVHGMYNPLIRHVTTVGTLLATGHFMNNSMRSTEVVTLAGFHVTVSAIGCIAAMIWCTVLSGFYKRQQLKLPATFAECKKAGESQNFIVYRAMHEFYFALAAVCTMAVPYCLERFQEAPIWWSLLALPLALVSWRGGNAFKQLVVAAVWVAAASNLIYTTVFAHGSVDLHTLVTTAASTGYSLVWISSLVAVVVTGALMAAAFRTPKVNALLPKAFDQEAKALGYSFYAYAAIIVAMAAPVLNSGVWNSVNYLCIDSLVICVMAIAARDGLMHKLGVIAGAGAMALFFAHFNTWELPVVLPVAALAYGLSMAYSYIHNKGGWKKTDFLPYGGEYAVSRELATKLETFWSWAGFATVVLACHQLVNQDFTAICWAAVSLITIGVGFYFDRFGYRLQGLVVLGLAIAELVVIDMTGGSLTWHPELAVTMFRGYESLFIGLCALLSGILYFRSEVLLKRVERASAAANSASAGSEDESK